LPPVYRSFREKLERPTIEIVKSRLNFSRLTVFLDTCHPAIGRPVTAMIVNGYASAVIQGASARFPPARLPRRRVCHDAQQLHGGGQPGLRPAQFVC
jgi:hypothetical protein